MKSVTMATKREMSDYTVFFSVLGHKKFIHKVLAKSESVRFQPLFKFFWCSQRIALKYKFHKILFSRYLVKTLDRRTDGWMDRYVQTYIPLPSPGDEK